jgi:hypothetical protein
MTMLKNEKVVCLAEYISQNLAFRDSADDLFNYINSLKKSSIVLDFSEIKSMSSSFAHQYVTNKKVTKKDITETNKSLNVIKMLELVERRNSKSREMNNEPFEVVELIYVEKIKNKSGVKEI